MAANAFQHDSHSASSVVRLVWLVAMLGALSGLAAFGWIGLRIHSVQAGHQRSEAVSNRAQESFDTLRAHRVQATQRLHAVITDHVKNDAGERSADSEPASTRDRRQDARRIREQAAIALESITELGGDRRESSEHLEVLTGRLDDVAEAVDAAIAAQQALHSTEDRLRETQLRLRKEFASTVAIVDQAVAITRLKMAKVLVRLRRESVDTLTEGLQDLVDGVKITEQVKQVQVDLHDLELLAEQLSASNDHDLLLSLKDNRIRQVLERMRRNAKRIPASSDAFLDQLSQIQEMLFGLGSGDEPRLQTMRVGDGGLYQLKADMLHQQRLLSEVYVEAGRLEAECRLQERQLAAHVAERCREAAAGNQQKLSETTSALIVAASIAAACFLYGTVWIAQVISTTMQKLVQRQSERDNALQRVAEEKAFLDSVLETAADAIVVIDPDGTIVQANDAAGEMFQTAVPDLVGVPISDYMNPDDAQRHAAYLEHALETGRRGVLQSSRRVRAKRANGEEFPAELSASRADLQDRVVFTGILRDMSDRILLEQQLDQAQKLESIGQLAAGVAHEINTPMQFVSDNVEFLGDCVQKLFEVVEIYGANLNASSPPVRWEDRLAEVEAAQQRCRFDYIRREVPLAIQETRAGTKRVIEIVQAMKQLSHPGSAKKTMTDINEAVRSTVTVTRNRWKYAADVDLDLEEDLPHVRAFAAEINQVLVNVIVNAADAIVDKNGSDGAIGRIGIRTRRKDDCVVLEVQDDGCGMPEEVRRRVFEPFFTTKAVGKGTGQGLAISYNVVVHHHGGRLRIDTALGEGTTFVIELPIQSQEDDAEGASDGHPQSAGAADDYATQLTAGSVGGDAILPNKGVY